MVGDFQKDPKEINEIYLIDFGVSRKFIDRSGKHKIESINVPFSGNTIFSSRNAHAERTLSRRDDIISLVYMMIYLIDTNITWFNFDLPAERQFKQVTEFKLKK
jgi:hypothetical protein